MEGELETKAKDWYR